MEAKNLNRSKAILIDLVCFVAGPSITGFCLLGKRAYGYNLQNRIGIAFGIGLIALGLLYRSWRKVSVCYSPEKKAEAETIGDLGTKRDIVQEKNEQSPVAEKTETQIKYIKHMKELKKSSPLSGISQKYKTYDEVPFYRQQWFFWLIYFPLHPIAIAILLSGDVYYQSKGEVKSFGWANRILAGLIAFGILCKVLLQLKS